VFRSSTLRGPGQLEQPVERAQHDAAPCHVDALQPLGEERLFEALAASASITIASTEGYI
jgi:hypothetical protein